MLFGVFLVVIGCLSMFINPASRVSWHVPAWIGYFLLVVGLLIVATV